MQRGVVIGARGQGQAEEREREVQKLIRAAVEHGEQEVVIGGVGGIDDAHEDAGGPGGEVATEKMKQGFQRADPREERGQPVKFSGEEVQDGLEFGVHSF